MNSNLGKRYEGRVVTEDRETMMQVFDCLPREVRDALNYSAFAFGTTNMPEALATMSADQMARKIKGYSAQLWRISWADEIGGNYDGEDGGTPARPGKRA